MVAATSQGSAARPNASPLPPSPLLSRTGVHVGFMRIRCVNAGGTGFLHAPEVGDTKVVLRIAGSIACGAGAEWFTSGHDAHDQRHLDNSGAPARHGDSSERPPPPYGR